MLKSTLTLIQFSKITKIIIEIPKSVRAKDVGRLQSMALHISAAAPRISVVNPRRKKDVKENRRVEREAPVMHNTTVKQYKLVTICPRYEYAVSSEIRCV